jgi:hypothetical protein
MQRELRMYGMTPYQLTGMQGGIQFGHAVQEYNNMVINLLKGVIRGERLSHEDSDLIDKFTDWAENHKTFIVLDGGTTNNFPERLGSLNSHLLKLQERGIICATFSEPDLGDQLTGFVFLVDERVFNRELWPNYDGTCYIDGTPEATEFWNWKMKFSDDEKEANNIVFLREWLPKFRLA